MRKKIILLGFGICLLLLAGFRLGAEVALDEVVQAGRFVFYRDHADPHKYYYVPDEPRLATKRDGTPEFTFIKYTKTDGATKGGIVHFLVTWGYSSGELNAAESALVMKDPQAKVAGPVPFKEGTFRIISATAGEGGLFNRRIVGEGKAPVMPGQKAAVSIALTEEGASLLWESFKNPASDVSVQFVLKFSGVTPAFQAKLKVDWDKVYSQHDIKLAAEGTIKVVKIKADVRATLEELRQKGAIQLDVVGENENMQKMLDTAYEHILQLMCDKVPTGAGETAAPSVRQPIAGLQPGLTSRLPLWMTALLAGENAVYSYGSPGQKAETQSQDSFCNEERRRQAESNARKARTQINMKRFGQVEELFLKAFEICPDPNYLFEIATFYQVYTFDIGACLDYCERFLDHPAAKNYPDHKAAAERNIGRANEAAIAFDEGTYYVNAEKYSEAIEAYQRAMNLWNHPKTAFNIALCYHYLGSRNGDIDSLKNAFDILQGLLELASSSPEGIFPQGLLDKINTELGELRTALNSGKPEDAKPRRGEIEKENPTKKGRVMSKATSGKLTEQIPADQAAATSVKPAETETAKKASTGQQPDITGAEARQQAQATQTGTAPAASQTTSTAARPATGTTPPATTGGGKPSSGQAATPTTPAAPEVKPIVSVELGYSFKRIKLSGKYEVDMRKRLREDREVVMSGNVSGVYQKYGEDKRFFTVVSLDDPTFQERSIEVILDGQDAEDFKNYINSVSVIFRKQRFGGPMMTGEVKFFEQQFAEKGNRLSFKYGRVNEASTEWLDYEYKTKWNFYGGVEWESDWTKTSDSVLTLSPPVRRRTIEISVDEDNILKNGIKAVALQIKHNIYGKDILKEVVINYDKGDPLQANYTYMHEEGKTGYSYKAIWLTMDGKEVETNWINRESPFIFAVFSK